MGEVRVGDRLLDAAGRPTTVTALSEVMIDRPCYEVEFSDGSVIVADGAHRWLTHTRASRRTGVRRRWSPPRRSGRRCGPRWPTGGQPLGADDRTARAAGATCRRAVHARVWLTTAPQRAVTPTTGRRGRRLGRPRGPRLAIRASVDRLLDCGSAAVVPRRRDGVRRRRLDASPAWTCGGTCTGGAGPALRRLPRPAVLGHLDAACSACCGTGTFRSPTCGPRGAAAGAARRAARRGRHGRRRRAACGSRVASPRLADDVARAGGEPRLPVHHRGRRATGRRRVSYTLSFSTADDVFRLERKRLAHKERRRAPSTAAAPGCATSWTCGRCRACRCAA